ncbi:MAG TPA: hypothetical protein DIU07_02285 [Rhodobacteraceae bacterium]|nr:hypothetical protein [Paracoccaceae bacterium]
MKPRRTSLGVLMSAILLIVLSGCGETLTSLENRVERSGADASVTDMRRFLLDDGFTRTDNSEADLWAAESTRAGTVTTIPDGAECYSRRPKRLGGEYWVCFAGGSEAQVKWREVFGYAYW